MIEEKYIEDVLKGYRRSEEKLRKLLRDEKIDIERMNMSLIALKNNRKVIKCLFKNNPSLEIRNPETREIIRNVRDDKDSYIDLIEILANRIFQALMMREMNIEDINRLLEGFKYRSPLSKYRIHEGSSIETDYPPLIGEQLIQRIKEERDPELLRDLFDEIKDEQVEDYNEDWLNEFADQYDLPNYPLRRLTAGAIISGREIPSKITSLFDEMRDCYMFGLYNSTIIFCRAILEECLKQHYENANPNVPTEEIENMQLFELLKKVNLPKELKKEAHEIRKKAKNILHRAQIQKSSEIQENALSAIRSVTLVVENLFI
jgi:hypothetical protein